MSLDFTGTDDCFRIRKVYAAPHRRWFHSCVDFWPTAVHHSSAPISMDAVVPVFINWMHLAYPQSTAQVLAQLGPVPASPAERSLWAGALVDSFTSADVGSRLLLAKTTAIRALLVTHCACVLLQDCRLQELLARGPWRRALWSSRRLDDERYRQGVVPGVDTYQPFSLRRCVRRRLVRWEWAVLVLVASVVRMPRVWMAIAGVGASVRGDDWIPLMGLTLWRRRRRKTPPTSSSVYTLVPPLVAQDTVGAFE